MRIIGLVVATALGACEPASPAALATPDPLVTSRFQPTAFSVEVHGHGRPVILIPGLACPGAVWNDTVAHLDGYETHVLTLAGFAGQPRIDAPLASTTRDELVRYIRDRQLVSPIIVGHSMGGLIAYWLAASEPELVGPTIVVDSGAAVAGDPDSATQARDMWKNASTDQFAQQIHDVFGSMAARPERLAPLLDNIAKSDHAALGDAIYELSAIDMRPQLTKIRAPVLVVLADRSLQDAFRRDASGIPDHTVVVIPNAGHFVMLDEPAAFFTTIDRFLSTHGRDPEPVAAL
jgi:N-formylmaleamate deformylase